MKPFEAGLVHRVLMLAAAALVGSALPALAQPKQLNVQPSFEKELARLIKASGFECPEIRAIYHVGADERGNIMRVVCGVVGGPVIDSPTFRIHSTFGGNAKISRWEQ
jgi:hypothetical protein